jgi:hypothetical protein
MRIPGSQITGLLVLLTLLCAARTEQSSAAAAKGPLRVHPENPRYFTDGTGRGVYLTGFQYWDVVREDGSPGPDAMEFTIESSGGPQRFKAPFAADAVLYLEIANSLSKQVELYHWVDFPLEAPGAADGLARWDVEGSCFWTHESGAQRTSLLWYSGSGDTYVYRFGGSFQGRWTGTTTSPVAALDGLTLTVDVTPSRNPNRIGWSGQRADEPAAWAHSRF